MKSEQKTFPVTGMSCAACAARVEKALSKTEGVDCASVNFAAATASVSFTPACTPEMLRKSVQEAGYDLLIEDITTEVIEEKRNHTFRSLKKRTALSVAFSIPIVVLGMFFMDLTWSKTVMCILTTVVICIAGRQFYINAWKQLKHGSANMDTLVALSTGVSYLFSLFNLLFPQFWISRGFEPHVYFESASVIVSFILLGRTLEERAKNSTDQALRRLMGLQPQTASTISDDGDERVISINAITPGMILVVHPGERIAADGTVVTGSSYIDESTLSGEPIPVTKNPGDKVFAGTVNQEGSFRFKADKTGKDMLLSRIIQMVQDAQGSKAPVQKLVDKIAAIFVPVIIGIASLSFVIWLAADQANGFSHGLLAFVTVLVIACPCALGLATPTAIMVGIGRGAELGILIKDADSLETARNINCIVLDKTGTITEGHPKVQDMVWNSSDPTHRSIFYSIESMSGHPLSKAITEKLEGSKTEMIDDFHIVPGMGITGRVGNTTYYSGNTALLEHHSILVPDMLKTEAERYESEAVTVVWFADDKEALAVTGISDSIKGSSKETVHDLNESGICVHMLTGDNETTARAIASQAGIKNFKSGVFPQDKALYIRDLQEKGNIVAMVGDGINDSAAMATADLSIAMGNGSDIAIDVAGMTIISSDLHKIPIALDLSRLTVRTIRENLFWAFIYNIIGIPIAAGVLYPLCGFLLNPMIASAAMAMSSLSVVTNSLRLRKRTLYDNKVRKDYVTFKNQHMHDFPDADNRTEPNRPDIMKKNYRVEGMACNHCRLNVEKALNTIDGVKATVTLDPPVASIEFQGDELTTDQLQKVISEKAGDYRIC